MSSEPIKTVGSMKLIEVATRRRVAISMLAVTLVLVGGFSQPDMGLVWGLIPLDRLRARLRPGAAGK